MSNVRLALALVSVMAAVGLAKCGSSPSPPAVVRAAPSPTPLLGYVSAGQRGALVRIDPRTLRPLGRRVDVGTGGCASRAGGTACWSAAPWSFSPDRSRVLVARNEQAAVRSLRIIDIARMRAADIALTGGTVSLVAWPARGRVLAVQELCCSELEQLLVVDVARRRVIARRALGGTVLRVARAGRELVLLLAPARSVGPARLAIVDGRGSVRFVALARTPAGQQLLDSANMRLKQSVPGLAVDPSGRRAFVVLPRLVADVDLAGLTVAYHDLAQHVSFLGRLRDWVDPSAYAKAVSGPVRSARWLGGGVLAITGSDEESGERPRLRAAGLNLIDTRDWSVRTIDPGASDVRAAGGLLLATGSGSDSRSIGLVAYGHDGTRRFQHFAGRQAWVTHVIGIRAYVEVFRPGAAAVSPYVVDLATGRAERARASRPPRLLLDAASSWWDEP